MRFFGSACPPAFYHSSRELGVLRRISEELDKVAGDTLDRNRVRAAFDAECVNVIRQHMAEHAAEVYRTFPGLKFFPPGTPPRQVVDEIRQSSLLTGERRRFKRLRRLLREALRELPPGLCANERRRRAVELQERALFTAYAKQYGLNGDVDEFRRLSRQAIKNTQGFIDQLLEAYVPISHRKQLEFAACVRAARDFPTLIGLAGYVHGKNPKQASAKGVISRRIGFEARVIAVLSQLEFEYLLGAYNPERVDAVREELIAVFENEVFDSSSSRRLVVVAELDPERAYRVRRKEDGAPCLQVYDETDPQAHQTATSARLVLPLDVRVASNNGKSVPVFFDTRRKEMVFAKLFRKLYREPEHITDHSGFTLVFFSQGPEVEIVADNLRRSIVTNPGQVWAQMSNAARAGAVDPNNPHSAVDRRAEKYICRWGGINHEIQLLDITTYVESLVSRTRVAHPIYKYLTLVDTVFPFIWPKELYGKDWMDAGFRDLLWQFQIGRIWTGPDNFSGTGQIHV